MYIAHGPISYLANEMLQKKKIVGLKPSQHTFLIACSLAFGVMPDLDLFLMMMIGRPAYSHHDIFTHTPFYWLIVWLGLLLVMKLVYRGMNKRMKQFFSKDFLKILLNSFLIAGISHFLADLLVGHIMFLYPFTTRYFTILKYLFEPSYFVGYFLSVYFAIELVIVVIALISLSKRFLKKVKWQSMAMYGLLSLTSVYLLFTMFLNTQTYNNSFLGISSMDDLDYDTLMNIQDMDIDNDGIDNILDAEREDLISSLRGVVDSNKITVSSKVGLRNQVVYRFGGLDSYRLVSQAFFESNSPIEPVLKDFYTQSMDKKSYSVDIDYQDVLREYYLSKDLLIDLNLNGSPILASGRVFFILDDDGEIMNMGMTMDRNRVAIVLPGERVVQYHTYEGILLFYGETISTFQICQ